MTINYSLWGGGVKSTSCEKKECHDIYNYQSQTKQNQSNVLQYLRAGVLFTPVKRQMRVITAIIICMAVNVIGREIPPANCELRIM